MFAWFALIVAGGMLLTALVNWLLRRLDIHPADPHATDRGGGELIARWERWTKNRHD